MHFPLRLCIVSTCGSFAIKKKGIHLDTFLFYGGIEFERPLRKHADGIFSGSGSSFFKMQNQPA
jgi:hypothetical protein